MSDSPIVLASKLVEALGAASVADRKKALAMVRGAFRSWKPSAPKSAPVKRKPSKPTKLPPDFTVSPEIEKMCRTERLADPHRVFVDFVDWAQRDGVEYINWESAFRIWMRSSITRTKYPTWEDSEAEEKRASQAKIKSVGAPQLSQAELDAIDAAAKENLDNAAADALLEEALSHFSGDE